MSKAIEKIKAKAEELADVRKLIAEIEAASKEKLDALKGKRETLQQELILAFGKEGLTSIKTDDGSSYSKAVRKGVEIVNERLALAWAIENRAVNIDLLQAKQKLAPIIEREGEMPPGFEPKEVEYISVRNPKAEKEPEKTS